MNLEELSLNNREISFTFWIFLCSILLLLNSSKLRKSISALLKLVFLTRLAFLFLAIVFYILITIVMVRNLGFWDITMLKDTIFWFLGTALVLTYEAEKIQEGKLTFKEIILDNCKLIILIEFISNQYVFSLQAEMLLLPILFFLSAFSYVAGLKNEHRNFKVFSDVILALVGFYAIGYAINGAIADYENLVSFITLKSVLLPPILTILYLPCVYFVAVYIVYENLFSRFYVNYRNDRHLLRNAKAKTFKLCLLNLAKVKRFSKEVKVWEIRSIEEFKIIVDDFNSKKKVLHKVA